MGTLYDIGPQGKCSSLYRDILVESIRRVYRKAALELEEYRIELSIHYQLERTRWSKTA
jgi:hypothetical protein